MQLTKAPTRRPNAATSHGISTSLDRVLAYDGRKPRVVFLRAFDVREELAEEVFRETLKWLWLGHIHRSDPSPSKPSELAIYQPLLIVDEMWHCFILCTREYAEFCDSHFGSFVHHAPNVGTGAENGDRADFASMISYVIEKLGSDTAKLWFGHYAITYTSDWLRARRKC